MHKICIATIYINSIIFIYSDKINFLSTVIKNVETKNHLWCLPLAILSVCHNKPSPINLYQERTLLYALHLCYFDLSHDVLNVDCPCIIIRTQHAQKEENHRKYVFDFSFSVSFVTKALISIKRRKSPKRNYFQPKTKHKAKPNTNQTTFNIIQVIPHRQTYQILKVTQVIRGHQKYLIIILPIFKIPLIFLDFQLLTKKLFSKKGFSRSNPELLHLSRQSKGQSVFK